MSRISIPTRDQAPAESQPTLDALNKMLGFVPNLHRVLATSPNALAGFMSLQGAMSKTLDVKTRDRIALAVSQANGCQYCVSAHSYRGANFAKLTPEEIALNRLGRSGDAKADAAVRFARQVVEQTGHVSDAELAALRSAGYTDGQVVEIVVISAQLVLTNFINNVFETDIDFPVVELEAVAA